MRVVPDALRRANLTSYQVKGTGRDSLHASIHVATFGRWEQAKNTPPPADEANVAVHVGGTPQRHDADGAHTNLPAEPYDAELQRVAAELQCTIAVAYEAIVSTTHKIGR